PAVAHSAHTGAETARLARDQRNFIGHALRSRVFEAWKESRHDRIVEYDARVFFQFSVSTPLRDRLRKVEFSRQSVARAVELGTDGAQQLEELADYLVKSFPHLFKAG